MGGRLTKHLLFVAAIGLMVAPAFASPQIMPVKGMKYATYDVATGELTPREGPARYGASVWAATQRSGYYYTQMSYGPGTTTLDWGDLAGPQDIGGFAFSYDTDIVLPNRFDVVIRFYAEENGWNSTGRVYQAGFVIEDCATADPGGEWTGWTVWVDLDPNGYWFTMSGSDLDPNHPTGGGLVDFGYTYWFTNLVPTPNNYTGPTIAGDPNILPCTCPGAENMWDDFFDPNLNNFTGTYYFGAGIFAQFYMELFEHENDDVTCPNPGVTGTYCFADIDCGSHPCDCLVNLGDLSRLLSNYGVQTGATHGDGDVEPAPPNGDGDVDLADLAQLLSQYGDNCN